MTALSALALLIWVAVLVRAAWLVVHPRRRVATAQAS
jgi:hypothetical protein